MIVHALRLTTLLAARTLSITEQGINRECRGGIVFVTGNSRALATGKALALIVVGTTAVVMTTGAVSTSENVNDTGDVVVEGQLEVGSGDDVPSKISVFAWPSNDVLAHIKVGDKFALDPVGSAEVASDGSFEVTLDKTDDLDRYVARSGDLNLYLSADDGSVEYAESVPIDLSSGSASASAVDDVLVDVGEVAVAGEVSDEGVPRDSSTAPAYVEKGCTATLVKNLGAKWIPIGGIFSTNTGATVDFQYAKGTASTLGAAVSTQGKEVGFSSGSATSMSSTSTVDFPSQTGIGSKLARTQFRYGNFSNACTYITGGVPFTSVSYIVRADLWIGGTNFVSASLPSATHCSTYLKGSTFTKDNSKQVTWTGAVSFYGVGLSAQTGWTSTGKLSVKFTNASGKLCGSGGYPTETDAYQLVVKPG
ncbi:MAG: hypothetical protein NVV57_02910 [Demequina sp.]|nr:hypothetical protein [Demequina sp.]